MSLIWGLVRCIRVQGSSATMPLRCGLLCLLSMLVLSACGGGGDSGDSTTQNAAGGAADDEVSANPSVDDGEDAGGESDTDPVGGADDSAAEPPQDQPPLADAGADASVSERTIVYLDANESSDAEGVLTSFRWDQIAGTTVALVDPLSARTSFLAPSVQGSETLSFELTVTDAANNADVDSIDIAVVDAGQVPDDPNEFLTWLDDLSSLYAGSQESAEAYYRAIDPLDEKTSLGEWLTANGFDDGVDAQATYRNAADLGFGRVMSMRTLFDGSVAAYVENYPSLNEAVAAVETGVRDGLLATVAMEYSPGPTGGEPYTKFYTYGPDDERVIAIDLDGRGAKFMPGLCNVCHGGQPQPLIAGEYPNGGDTQAQFLPWDLETYEFSEVAGFTRADQEAELKALNAGSLSTYPANAAAAVTQGDWPGSAARELIEGWYGGTELPDEFDPNFVPEGWRAAINGGPTGNPSGIEDLYLDVIAPNCRACHITRGRYFSEYPEGEFIDFSSYARFMAYEDRIEELLYETGVMPDALVTYAQFWTNHDGVVGAEALARYLGIDATQQRPGRPVADAGPDRDVALGTVTLNGAASSFADEFEWTFATAGRPAGSNATISAGDTATPTITTDVPGVYRLQLIVSKDGEASEPVFVRLTALFGTDPVRFSVDITSIVVRSCASCHSEGREQSVAGIPVRFDEPLALYERLRAYVNTQDYDASPFLSKPAGVRHGGQTTPGFDLSGAPGSDRDDYDRVLQWIGEGAPNN